jgi:hypothetical protein
MPLPISPHPNTPTVLILIDSHPTLSGRQEQKIRRSGDQKLQRTGNYQNQILLFF